MRAAIAPMKIRVLGSGAGGGYPQWNCNTLRARFERGHHCEAHRCESEGGGEHGTGVEAVMEIMQATGEAMGLDAEV